jgi:NADPH2:quinone reductase
MLQYVDLDDPTPGEGEVVVEIARAGINFADTHATRNDYLAEQSLPLVPGTEVAGRTADGRRVAALLGSGGYAEKAVVPESLLIPLPESGHVLFGKMGGNEVTLSASSK